MRFSQVAYLNCVHVHTDFAQKVHEKVKKSKEIKFKPKLTGHAHTDFAQKVH